MRVSDFDYLLPEELIAQRPAEPRTASRLLVVKPDRFDDRGFTHLPAELEAGDLLVLNDTRVVRARLHGRKVTGGRIEVFVERVEGVHRIAARVRASRGLRVGGAILIDSEAADPARAECVGRDGELHHIEFERPVAGILERHGRVPLPPYVRRPDDAADAVRYQTVYARRGGAVAAPTAGLHFDRAMLSAIAGRGVGIGTLTLHVGSGTYQPIRGEDPSRHVMHGERVDVPARLCEQVEAAKARGGRVIAVGTTCVRALETAAAGGRLRPWSGTTRLFIRPGFEFRCVDALLTNFHAPRTTLLLLIAAFAGYERTLAAYRHAVAVRYRFLSYGDAMFIGRRAG